MEIGQLLGKEIHPNGNDNDTMYVGRNLIKWSLNLIVVPVFKCKLTNIIYGLKHTVSGARNYLNHFNDF